MRLLDHPFVDRFLIPILALLLVMGLVSVFTRAQEKSNWTPRVQILINAKTELGEFHDALYLDQREYEALKPEDIDKQVNDRVEAWVAFVREQSTKPPVEPTKEELIARQDELQKQLDSLVTSVIAKADVAKADLTAISAKLKATAAAIDTAASAKPAGEVPPR